MFRLAIILSVVGAVASQQRLSDADVERALQAGVNKQYNDLISTCGATPYVAENLSEGLRGGGNSVGSGGNSLGNVNAVTGFPGHLYDTGTFSVTVSTHVGRIAFLAANATRLQKTFTLADVGNDLRGPAIFVHVEPDKPRMDDRDYHVAAVIDAVVLESKSDRSKVLRPVSLTSEQVEWGRLLGRTVTGNRAIATFAYNAVRSLPPADFDVVVITSPGERRCKVGRGDRERLFRAGG